MMKRNFGLRTFLLLLAAFPLHASGPSPQKPNVLFIIADDLNNDLGCYGNPDVKSPNIDALARRGVRFDRAYCQYPQCNPSRTSFLTGLRPDSTHVFNNDVSPRTALPNALYLPNFFKQQGWFTATLGKVAHYPGLLQTDVVARGGGGGKKARRAAKAAAGVDADEQTIDGQSARYAVELIEQHREQPFFIAVGFHRPHVPLEAPKKYFTYDAAKLMLVSPPPGYPKGVPAAALDTSRGSAGGEATRRKTVGDYYACISFVDAQVGLLLDALERLKLWDNTIVVLIGDHGWLHGEHGGEGKQSLFEPSARAPLIVVAPGRKAGAVSPRLVEFVDIFPSLAELCGLKAPADLEGSSLVPLLDDPTREWKKAAFTVTARSESGRAKKQRNPQTDVLARSVRTERYVFNDWGDGKSFELYDHQADPGEYANLAADPGHAAVVQEMSALLKAGWQAARPAAH